MILQCDQCNTKFKLDDSKIKDGGVKVRCSKCKHVFLVNKDPQEETDFDSILDGLNSPAPSAEPAPSTPEPEDNTPAISTGFAQLKQMLSAADAGEEKQQEGDQGNLDFSEFSFNEDEEAASEPEPETAAKTYDLSGFNPDEEDTSETGFAVDPGSFDSPADFSGQAADENENAFEQDFTGGSGTDAAAIADSQPASDDLALGDFDFNSDDASTADTTAGEDTKAPGEFDFNEFSFEADDSKAEPPVADAGESAAAPGDPFEFGSFDFDSAEAASQQPASEPDLEAAQIPGELDFDMSGSGADNPQPQTLETPQPDAPGEFSFDFAEETSGSEPVTPSASVLAETSSAVDEIPSFSFDDPQEELSGTDNLQALSKQSSKETSEEGQAADQGAFPDLAAIDFGQVASPVTPEENVRHEALLDALVGGAKEEPVAAVAGPGFAAAGSNLQEDYPPLSISSRRKGSSFFTFAGLGVFVLVLVALVGAGIFFLKDWPSVLNKAGLGAFVKKLGITSVEEGRINVKNTAGSFVVNQNGGELFVIRGIAVNHYRKPRASIQVKASIFGKNGVVAMQKTAYCGNNLSKEQLESLPLEKLEAAMNNQFGDSLSNLGIEPGKEIPFVLIFTKIPQDVSEFAVEVTGSTVAGQ